MGQFLPPFLWRIPDLALDPGYRWVRLDKPGRKHAWILAFLRTPHTGK